MIARSIAWVFEVWHRWFSPLLGKSCRFEPSCSIYGAQSLRRHGLFKGLWLTLRRLLRCHPWGGHGHDPVPD